MRFDTPSSFIEMEQVKASGLTPSSVIKMYATSSQRSGLLIPSSSTKMHHPDGFNFIHRPRPGLLVSCGHPNYFIKMEQVTASSLTRSSFIKMNATASRRHRPGADSLRQPKLLLQDGTSESIWFDSKLLHQNGCNFITEIWPAGFLRHSKFHQCGTSEGMWFDSKFLYADGRHFITETSTWPSDSLRHYKFLHQDGASANIEFDSKFLHQYGCHLIAETST